MWLKIFPITVFFHFFIEVQKLSKIDILQNVLCPPTECVLFSPTYVIIPLNLASSYQKSLVRTGLRAYQSPVGESRASEKHISTNDISNNKAEEIGGIMPSSVLMKMSTF